MCERNQAKIGFRIFFLFASISARFLSARVSIMCKKAMIAPSNSVPRPVLIVVGEKAFQMMFSQIFVAMKSEIPFICTCIYYI